MDKNTVEKVILECSVTFDKIEESYIMCKTFRKAFDCEVIDWVNSKKNCPCCRSNWARL